MVEKFKNPSIPLDERVQDLISRLTLEEKIALIPQYQEEIPRLGINKYKHGTEGAHGIAWLGEATVFPQNIGLACTWNDALLNKIGSAIGDEARVFYQRDPEVNGLTIWSPTVDMERDPRWGRTEEAYGEDPHLTGKLTTELIKGMQGDHPVYLKTAATLKHFVGNNNEVGRGERSVTIPPRSLREYYYKAFEPQIKEGHVQSVMTAYNAVNGNLCNINPDVNGVLREEWGLDGFIVSDAGDVLGTVNDHQYTDSYAKAVAWSIQHGIDSITDEKEFVIRATRDAIDQGLLSEKNLDRALTNTFTVRFRLGEFDPVGLNPYENMPEEVVMSEGHTALTLQAAKESIVLLKNNQLLPLRKKTTAVIGMMAEEVYTDWYSGTLPYEVTPLEGLQKAFGSHIHYADGSRRIQLVSQTTGKYVQVDPVTGALKAIAENSGEAETFIYRDWGWGSETLQSEATRKFVTAVDSGELAAIAEEAKGWFVKEVVRFKTSDELQVLYTWNDAPVMVEDDGTVLHGQGEAEQWKIEIIDDGISRAVEAAKDSEQAIVFVGNCPYINGKETMDRPSLHLPPEQEALLKAVYEANPNTVVVIIGSYPFAVNWADEHVPAILYTSHSGQELGTALAEVITGDYNPAGRLNMTWYRSEADLPNLMDYDIIKGKRTYQYFEGETLYPFGHGLSYTMFTYEELNLSSTRLQAGDDLKVTVTVKNSGHVAGDEVVQIYIKANQSSVIRPLKQLVGFKRVHLESGETKNIDFIIKESEFAFWDVSQEKFLMETGEYMVMAGPTSAQFKQEAKVMIDGETVPPRSLQFVKAKNFDDYHMIELDECIEGGHSVVSNGKNSWVAYHHVQLPGEAVSFFARVSNSAKQPTELEIRTEGIDGPILGRCVIPATGGKQAWTTVECQLSHITGEMNDLYVVFKGECRISTFSVK